LRECSWKLLHHLLPHLLHESLLRCIKVPPALLQTLLQDLSRCSCPIGSPLAEHPAA
jgi:hypothetical protein